MHVLMKRISFKFEKNSHKYFKTFYFIRPEATPLFEMILGQGCFFFYVFQLSFVQAAPMLYSKTGENDISTVKYKFEPQHR